MRRRFAAALLALLTALTLAGCASYATPDTSSIGLSYTGGDWDAKYFSKCVQPGGNEAEDWGGYTAYYPVGVITWDFSIRPGADSGPILVSTSNNQEMIQSGTISLRLKTDCAEYTDAGGKVWKGGIIQKFHEEIGQRNGASFGEDSAVKPAGWVPTLSKFVGAPAERAMDQAAGGGQVNPETGAVSTGYTWQQLYSEAAVQAAFSKVVTDTLPGRIQAATGGEMYFDIISVELDKPTVPEQLRNELVAQEAALLSQSTANQQKTFAESFPGGLTGYQAFQRQQAETKCLNDGKCQFVPAGVSVPVR
jgi:hypothetical protein